MLSVLLLALAQDIVLPESVIIAPRANDSVTATVAKVQRLSGEELRETGERSLPRAIAKAAGVWVQETSLGGGAPVIRGLLGNQILVVVDGVIIAAPLVEVLGVAVLGEKDALAAAAR